MTESGTRSNSDELHWIAFDYIKSQYFRVIHTDGVIGALTPQGNLHIAFYSERPAIPRRLVHMLDSAGNLGLPIPSETVSRDSIVREVDCDVHMTIAVARAFHEWLGGQISRAEHAENSTAKDG